MPFVPKSFSIKIEKGPESCVVHKESAIANKQEDTIGNETWVEIKPKRRQGPHPGKPLQGNPNDSFTGLTEKGPKGKDQGPSKEGPILKDSNAHSQPKVLKVQGHLDGISSRPLQHNSLEDHFLVGSDPLLNSNWQLRFAYICGLNSFSCCHAWLITLLSLLWILTVKCSFLISNPWRLWSADHPRIWNLFLLHCFVIKLSIKVLFYHVYQLDDSHSKVLGNGQDLLVDETIDSNSSILRKEIEGKLSYPTPLFPDFLLKVRFFKGIFC